MKQVRSKLLLKTFDGSLTKLIVKPKYMDTKVEFQIKYYDYDGDGSLCPATLRFHHVVSLDFEVNYCDNYIGAELFGFYEIFEETCKRDLLEKAFQNRRAGYLLHGNYDYDPGEPHDMLNWREPIQEVEQSLGEYHLYQQQTQGGIYLILCKGYELIGK